MEGKRIFYKDSIRKLKKLEGYLKRGLTQAGS
jgi:hypothetical protein